MTIGFSLSISPFCPFDVAISSAAFVRAGDYTRFVVGFNPFI
jgi:hypothetical protein